MFAIAFDLIVKEVSSRHPKSVATAYADIGATLAGFGFRWVQGSIYVCENEDMANLWVKHIMMKNKWPCACSKNEPNKTLQGERRKRRAPELFL